MAHEYQLVAYPDKAVMDQILEERSRFSEEYKSRLKSEPRPHVPIASFVAKEELEGTLIRWLQRICSQEQGFTITLNNYSGYPGGTILVRIPEVTAIQNFVRQMDVIKDFIEPSPRGLYRRPHISIASNLDPGTYEKALSEYSRRVFYGHFTVNELVLLKKTSRYTQVKTVQVFGLLPEGNDLFNKVA